METVTFKIEDGEKTQDWRNPAVENFYPTKKIKIFDCGEQVGHCLVMPCQHQLSWIFIEKKYRNLGFAFALLAYASLEFHINNLICFSNEEDINLQRLKDLYERHGFRASSDNSMVR